MTYHIETTYDNFKNMILCSFSWRNRSSTQISDIYLLFFPNSNDFSYAVHIGTPLAKVQKMLSNVWLLKRKTLFFQVEQDINHSEPILVKTEFLNKIDDRLKLFLGFGKKADLEIYPKTNLYTMPMNKKTLQKLC